MKRMGELVNFIIDVKIPPEAAQILWNKQSTHQHVFNKMRKFKFYISNWIVVSPTGIKPAQDTEMLSLAPAILCIEVLQVTIN